MPQPDEQEKAQQEKSEPALSTRVIPAEQIFEGQREVLIEHDGEHYRLRITRRGKLILQK